MNIVVLHDLKGAELIVNFDNVNAAIRRKPDENSVIKTPFTKLFYAHRDMTMGAMGFPDTVQETPDEIYKLIGKKK